MLLKGLHGEEGGGLLSCDNGTMCQGVLIKRASGVEGAMRGE